MEDILNSINGVTGVKGCFISDDKGEIIACSMPELPDETILLDIGHVISQTTSALATSHRRKIDDIDLIYAQGRFIVKNLGEGYLCISCVRNFNVPLLNMSVNFAVKKLSQEVITLKEQGVELEKKQMVLKSPWGKLNTEVCAIISAARERSVILQAFGDSAIRLHCPDADPWLIQLDEGTLELIGHESQTTQISQVLIKQGYSPERVSRATRGSNQLNFLHPSEGLKLRVFMDVIKMNRQLDLTKRLNLIDDAISLADLLLWQLQYEPFDDKKTRVVFNIINDHELGITGESDKIDASRILDVCKDDFEWYKKVTTNLEESIVWVKGSMGDSASMFQERANHLLQLLKDVPKTGSFQLRGLFDEDLSL